MFASHPDFALTPLPEYGAQMLRPSLSLAVGVAAGIYLAQNYNIPDIKLLAQRGLARLAALERERRKDD